TFVLMFYFFFQAEDGIRDFHVTGVQTCALPILAKVEVIRACRRINPATLPEATALLASLDLIPLSGTVIDEGANVGATTLRSLEIGRASCRERVKSVGAD